jgi:multiple sugar transport system permease protein
MSTPDPRRRRRPPEARRRLAISLSIGLVLLAGALTTAFPLLWMIAGSFKPQREAIDFPPTLLPQEPTLANYHRLFTELDFGRYLGNTVIVVLIGGVGLLFMAMAGYAFAKYRFRGKGWLFFLVLATLMIPVQVTMIPTYLILNGMKLTNT